MMVVDVKLDSKISARTINCYGPQEFSRKKKSAEGEAENTDPQPDKKIFFQKLQTEIQNAKSAGHLLCIQMYANSKFDREIIPNDLSLKMSENGKILYDIIKTEDLILVNASNKCLGTITRYRKTTKTTKTSVLDFFILCRNFFEMLKSMTIDEERSLVLTKYSTRKGLKQIVESDHNPMWCEFNLKWSSFIKTKRKEAFNLKDTQSLETFKCYNDKNDKLIDSLIRAEDVVSGGRKWFSELKDSVYKCFKKISLNSGNKDKKIQNLLEEKRMLKKEIKHCQKMSLALNINELVQKAGNIDQKIANHSSDRNLKLISNHVEEMQIQGKFDVTKMWKLKRKLCPKSLEMPSAKLDEKGKLITDKSKLLDLYKRTYIQRLSPRPILPKYQTIFELKNYLFDLRMKVTSRNKSPVWT